MRADDIPVGEGRTLVVDGTQVAVFRLRDGSVRAIEAVCPHRGGPLADGLADDCVVVCPLHGHAFDLRTGAEASGAALSVRSYPVEVVDGLVRLTD
jgi:nitrite reductase (NADH) small subunit